MKVFNPDSPSQEGEDLNLSTSPADRAAVLQIHQQAMQAVISLTIHCLDLCYGQTERGTSAEVPRGKESCL